MTHDIRRQPKGISTGGQFAEAIHPESRLRLGSSPLTGGSGLETDELIDLACADGGEGFRPMLVHEAEAVETEGGRELHRQMLDARHNRQTRYLLDRAAAYDLKPSVCDGLHELGYTNINDLTGGTGRNISTPRNILENRISPERLAVMGRAGARTNLSEWEKDAYYRAPVEDLAEVIDNDRITPFDRYRALAVLTDPDRGQRIDEACSMGLSQKALIEATDYPLDTLVGIRENLTDKGRTPWNILRMAERGITGRHLETFGIRACDRFDGPSLDKVEMKPATLRSLASGDGTATLEQLKKYNEAGFTKGSDLRATRAAMGETNVDTLAAARRYATGEQLGTYRAKLRHDLTLEEAEAVGALVSLGYNTPDDLARHTAAIHTPSSTNVDRAKPVLAVYADLAKSGVTPERLGELTRAGIPVDQAAAYRDSTTEWSDGQPFRDAIAEQDRRRVEQGWIRRAPGWEFTEQNFRAGV